MPLVKNRTSAFLRSVGLALLLACVIQGVFLLLLAPHLPREFALLCKPAAETSRRFELDAAPLLVLENADGNVSVNTHDAQRVVIEADMRVFALDSASDDDAAAYLDSLLALEQSDEAIHVRTEPGFRPENLELVVDYTLWAPKGADVTIYGGNGNIRVGKGAGRIRVEGVNADIVVDEPGGAVTARSTNGRIRVYDAPDGATLETINGSIFAHMKGGALQATTTNGDIVANLLDSKVRACRLNALNGGITVGMMEGCGGHVEAATGRGVVRSDLPVQSASTGQKALQGHVGEGDMDLSMHSLNGNIWITRRGHEDRSPAGS